MTFIVFGIVILVKYLPLYFYDIWKNLSQEISKLLINSLKIFLLFIPFFLRLDILWAILFYCDPVMGFCNEAGKTTAFSSFSLFWFTFPFSFDPPPPFWTDRPRTSSWR